MAGTRSSRNGACREASISDENSVSSNGPTDAAQSSPEGNKKIDKRTKRKKEFAKITGDQDIFCWQCHRDGSVVIPCQTCKRVFHRRCTKLESVPEGPWTCPECSTKVTAESWTTRSEAMKSINQERFNKLLKFVIDRIHQHEGSVHYKDPVDVREYPDYPEFVINPMDLTRIENSVRNGEYQCTETFFADLKYLVHNSYIYNGNVELTTIARGIIKMAKQEIEEIENCPSCYYHAHMIDESEWFSEACEKPHLLVWAKLKGFPFWPGKVMKALKEQVDVRFFGDHNRSWVAPDNIHLLCSPALMGKKNGGGYEEAVEELFEHIKKLQTKFGTFQFVNERSKYKPAEHATYLKYMLPELGSSDGGKTTDVTLLKRTSTNVLNGDCKKLKVDSNTRLSNDSSFHEERSMINGVITLDDEVQIKEEGVGYFNERETEVMGAGMNDRLSEGSLVDSAVKNDSPFRESVSDAFVTSSSDVRSETAPAASENLANRIKVKPLAALCASSTVDHESTKAESKGAAIAVSGKKKKSANGLDRELMIEHMEEIISRVSVGEFSIQKTAPVKKGCSIPSPPPLVKPPNPGQAVEKVVHRKVNPLSEPAVKRTINDSIHCNDSNLESINQWSKLPKNGGPGIFEEMCKIADKVANTENSPSALDDIKKMMSEMKKLIFLQQRASLELIDNTRESVEEILDIFEIEKEGIDELKSELNENLRKIKLTQWCVCCLKEAKFYCCWGTSYCSVPCREKHWASHHSTCEQINKTSNERNPPPLQVNNSKVTIPPESLPREGIISPKLVGKYLVPKTQCISSTAIIQDGKAHLLTSPNRFSLIPAGKLLSKTGTPGKVLDTTQKLVNVKLTNLGKPVDNGKGQKVLLMNQGALPRDGRVVLMTDPKGKSPQQVSNKIFLVQNPNSSQTSPVKINKIAQPIKFFKSI